MFFAFGSRVLEVFDPCTTINAVRRWAFGRTSTPELYLQADANLYFTIIEQHRLFEPMALRISQKYAEMLGLVWFSLFYVMVFPLGLVISVAGLIWNYLVDKVRLLSHPVESHYPPLPDS